MKNITLLLALALSLPSFAMPMMAPPPPAINPAAVHTMHHSTAATNAALHANQQALTAHNSQNNSRNFQHGSQYYTANLDGLRLYVDTLKEGNTDLYTTLDGKLKTLEQKNLLANVITGSAIVGSLIYFSTMDLESDSTSTPLIIFAVGTGIGQLVRPNANDYLNFINEHNRLNPESGLNLSFGITPGANGAGIELAYGF